MKKLVLGTLICSGLGMAVGCSPIEEGFVEVSYIINDDTCSSSNGLQITADDVPLSIFDCDALGGTELTDALDLGTYDIRVQLIDDSSGSQILLAESDAVTVDLLSDGDIAPVDIDFLAEAGFFGINWTLETAGGAPVACEDVAATDVDVIATVFGGSSFADFQFDCVGFTGGNVVIGELRLDEYVVTVQISDLDGIGDDGAVSSTVEFNGLDDGAVLNVGDVTVQLEDTVFETL